MEPLTGINHYSQQTTHAEGDEKKIEMLAMFLCDSGIIPLGPDKNAKNRNFGWSSAKNTERMIYRDRAAAIFYNMDTNAIAA